MADQYAAMPEAGWTIQDEDQYLLDRAIRILIVETAARNETGLRVPHMVRTEIPIGDLSPETVLAALPGVSAHAVHDDGVLVAYTAVVDPRCETVGDAVDLVCRHLQDRALPVASVRIGGAVAASTIAPTVRDMQRQHRHVGLHRIRPLGLRRTEQ